MTRRLPQIHQHVRPGIPYLLRHLRSVVDFQIVSTSFLGFVLLLVLVGLESERTEGFGGPGFLVGVDLGLGGSERAPFGSDGFLGEFFEDLRGRRREVEEEG